MVPDTGHEIMLERPAPAFLAALSSWLPLAGSEIADPEPLGSEEQCDER